MKRINITPEWQAIAALTIIKLTLHLITATNYELQRDAYLYLALGDHLDFGFVSVPPSIAVFAAMVQTFFGQSVLAVRLVPALVGAASIFVVGMLARELGGRVWAIVIACVAFLLSPAFLRTNGLFQPVAFNQFYWLLSAFVIVKLLKTQAPRYWIALGTIWGLAFLNKYSICFFVFGFLLALLLTPERKLLFSKHAAIGALLALAIISPNLLWQYNHNWPVVTHMVGLQQTQLAHVRVSDFMIGQLLMNVHAVLVWAFGLFFLLFAKEMRRYRSLGLTALMVTGILLLLSGKAYYTLGLYPILMSAGGVGLEASLRSSRPIWKPAIVVAVLLGALPVLPYSLPVLSQKGMVAYGMATKAYGFEGALRWEDGEVHELPQDYADMTGWNQLAGIVIRTYNSLDATERASCQIYAENYGQAGTIEFHGKAFDLPCPISFSGSFLLWAPDRVAADVFIYVNHELGEDIASAFGSIELVGTVDDPYFRENGVQVYLCKSPKPEFFSFYSEKVAALKARFSRRPD